MTTTAPTGKNLVVEWLRDEDELPHPTGEESNWSENWLTYGWDPDQNIGVYFHIGRHPGPLGVYETTFNVYLAGDRLLTHRGSGPNNTGRKGPTIGPVSYACLEPFHRWRKRFHGSVRATTGDELRAGPLQDGPYIDVSLDFTSTASSPVFDFGAEKLDQTWGWGHYEQHHEFTAALTIGDLRYDLRGVGLRDHSRDWAGVGDTTWYHGQFPSGRSFVVVAVPGRPPAKPFIHGVIGAIDRPCTRSTWWSSLR
jgi:hypothetical protein